MGVGCDRPVRSRSCAAQSSSRAATTCSHWRALAPNVRMMRCARSLPGSDMRERPDTLRILNVWNQPSSTAPPTSIAARRRRLLDGDRQSIRRAAFSMKPYYEDARAGIVIYHGDAREIVPTLNADLIVTDPPYGLSVPGATQIGQLGKGTRSLDFFENDSAEDGYAHADWLVSTATTSLSSTGSIYAWVGHRQFARMVTALESAGWNTRFLVWSRLCPVPPAPGAGWPSGASLCIYGYRPGRTWTHSGRTVPRSNVIVSDNYRHGQPEKNGHPTQMNPSLILPLIEASSLVGHTVLDPFMGGVQRYGLRSVSAAGRSALRSKKDSLRSPPSASSRKSFHSTGR